MDSQWTVGHNVTRYPLSCRGDVFWIDVKNELNTGERNRILFAGIKLMHADMQTRPEVDLEQSNFEKIFVWISDWSLADKDGKKLVFTDADLLRSLRTDVFDLIDSTISTHAQKVSDESKKASTPQTPMDATAAPKAISS